jgi:hypothetical protein
MSGSLMAGLWAVIPVLSETAEKCELKKRDPVPHTMGSCVS